MKNIEQQSTLLSLQLCRGIASVLVLYHHSSEVVYAYYNDFVLRKYFDFGFAGVDFFFLLSGFIIFYSSHKLFNHREHIAVYLKKRIIRVYPIYWIVILPLLAAFMMVNGSINKDYSFSFVELLKTFTLYPGHNKLTIVSWTLSHEIYFYLLVGLLILNRNFIVLLYGIIALSFLQMILLILKVNIESVFIINFLFSIYNLEFFLGAVSFYLFKNYIIPNQQSRIMLLAGLVLFIIGGLIFLAFERSSGIRIVCFGLPSFMILLSLINLERNLKIQVPSFFVKLGDASYVLYLIHYPIISLGNKLYVKGYFGTQHHIVFNVLLALSCIVLSLFIHRFVEKPIIRGLNTALLKKA